MKTKPILGSFLILLAAYYSSFAIPSVTNCNTTVYTNVADPVKLVFAPDGTLFVGRDNSGSGGSPSDAVKIHKVATNATSKVEFGNSALADPDAVGYDAVGLVSGTPGAVLVGGAAGGSGATISKITPAGVVSTLFGGVITTANNPGEFLFDAGGRVYISDTSLHRVLTTASSAAPTVLCVSTGAYALAFDVSNRLAVGSFDLPRIQLFSTNGTLLVTNFATIRAGAPVVAGRGDAFWGRDLYSLNNLGQLLRIDPLGTNTVIVSSGFANPCQLAFGPDHNLYVSEFATDTIYKISPIPRGPTHWWPLDGNLIDVIGGENGFASNGTFYVAGQVGQAFDFYGTNYINFGTNAGVVGISDFSVTMWVKMFSSLTSGAKMLSGETNACPGSTYWRASLSANSTTTSRPAFSIQGGNLTQLSAIPGNQATNNIEDGDWHHVAFVRQGATCAVYRDGVVISTDSATAVANITGDIRLICGHDLCNADGGVQQYRGQMDEIKMFGVALTPAEIIADMTRPTLNIASLPGAVRLTWTTNSSGFLLETNSAVDTTNWGVLTTNYSIIETNFAVTNAVDNRARYFRLHKP